MGKYAVKRVLSMIPLLIVISIIIFSHDTEDGAQRIPASVSNCTAHSLWIIFRQGDNGCTGNPLTRFRMYKPCF